MRFVPRLLILLTLAASLLGFACNSDDKDPDRVDQATPTATPVGETDPSGLGRPGPTPTPDPRIAPPQTVLIDLATRRILPLAPAGERAGRISFSPDGRWLLYYNRHGDIESPTFEIFRIDLDSPGLEPELLYEGGFLFGFLEPFSSNGDFAFVAMDEQRTRWPAVMRPDGSVHRLSVPGHVTSWSPDGRWLTYEEFYHGEDAEGNEPLIAQYLVDTESWAERKIGESGPCHCDGNPRPVWAPDSSKFIYTYLAGEFPDGYSVNEVHFPDGRPPVQIEDDRGWLDSQRYITRVYGDDTYDIVAVDFTTGARTVLFKGNLRGRSLRMSPTELLFFTEGKLLNPDGDVVASVPGGFRSWSPDGQHILTFSNGTSCGRGYRLQATNGELVGCGPYPPEGSPFDYDLENDALAFIVPGNPEVEFLVDVYVLDFATGERRLIVEDFVAASTCVELSPDSRFLVLGHACGV